VLKRLKKHQTTKGRGGEGRGGEGWGGGVGRRGGEKVSIITTSQLPKKIENFDKNIEKRVRARARLSVCLSAC
jgi:hypothetical protein